MAGSPWGGSEALWARTAELALRQGHQVHLCLNRHRQTPPAVENLQELGAVTHFRTEPSGRVQRLFRRIIRRFLPKLYAEFLSPFRSATRTKPDIVCISEGVAFSTVEFPDLHHLLAANRLPYVLIVHHNLESLVLNDDTRNRAAGIVSRAVTNAFVSKRSHALAERQLARSIPHFTVLQNPVNLAEIRVLDWPETPFASFATVARLHAAQKGQDILFETLAGERWRNRQWRLNLYGGGPDREYLASLAEFYSISDRVSFCGHTDDIRSVWAENHALLLPSRDEGGPPISLSEAMLCGRPVVATNVGAVSEWLDDGESGIIAPAATAELLGAALERFWECRDRWQEMGRVAHERAVRKMDSTPDQTLLDLLLRAATGPERSESGVPVSLPA